MSKEELLDEQLLKLLKDPKYASLVDNIDAIIVFKKGKWVGTVKGSEVHQHKQLRLDEKHE